MAGIADGVAVIPAKLAADIVRSLEPGAVTIEADDDQAKIASGRSQFAVRVLPAEEFPMAQGEVASEAVTVTSNELADALRQVVRAASGDEARPILTGVLFMATADGMQLIATDSYRLAVRQLPGSTLVTRRAEGAHPVARLGRTATPARRRAASARCGWARPRRASRSAR